MIPLETITPDNWRLGLSVREDQRKYVSDSSLSTIAINEIEKS